jgi:hypothetical protein
VCIVYQRRPNFATGYKKGVVRPDQPIKQSPLAPPADTTLKDLQLPPTAANLDPHHITTFASDRPTTQHSTLTTTGHRDIKALPLLYQLPTMSAKNRLVILKLSPKHLVAFPHDAPPQSTPASAPDTPKIEHTVIARTARRRAKAKGPCAQEADHRCCRWHHDDQRRVKGTRQAGPQDKEAEAGRPDQRP